jgi:hypothetical protein
MRYKKYRFLLTLLFIVLLSLSSYAITIPSISDAFKNANIIAIEIFVDVPEKLLVSSKENFSNHLINSIYVELKAKLPSSINIYKDFNDEVVKSLLEEDDNLNSLLQQDNYYTDSEQWTEEDKDLILRSLLDKFTQLGQLFVTVFISERADSGYYGVIILDFYRRASVTTSFIQHDSFSFDASVYNDYMIITGRTDLEDHIISSVNKLVISFISSFYEGRSDL